MGLIILGKNRDDKGSQLEQLTKALLKSQGFTNIATNVQVGGGSELDVTAVKKDTTGIKEITTPVLCECKAHQNPIALPDWLKFIGKLAIARRKNDRTIGLMLALSGANGNVVGSYNDDFTSDNTVQLIANDDLFLLLQRIYHLSEVDTVRGGISNIQGLEAEEVDLVYYNKKLYWLVSLGNGKYTLCDASGNVAEKKSIKDILPLLKDSTPFDEVGYVDVFDDVELKRRISLLKVRVINELVNNRVINKKRIDAIAREIGTGQIDVDAITKNDPFMTTTKIKGRKKIKLKDNLNITDFYRFILTTGTPVELFTSDYYQSHIDKKLLDEVWQIQGGFTVDEEDMVNCLNVFKLSPSSLLYALVPDRMLSSYEAVKSDEGMRFMYQSHFKSELARRLQADFQNQGLHKMFMMLGVDSATIETKMKVGNKEESFLLESKQKFKLVGIQDSNQAVMIVTKDDVD